ncbi:MAG: hypothetical protein OEM67_07420 [Thermoleophilia bacterium]|nr:hypothetical protein [Thermoleophilia bacterium]MDH3725050.1 hypothetical protein [Thermoleophilia bacterium]
MVIKYVLGAGIYVVTGEAVDEVGSAAWLAFRLVFVAAALSALSLCELVTKYPGAAGIIIYVDRALKRPTLSFAVGLAVLASGLTSAATAASAFGSDCLTLGAAACAALIVNQAIAGSLTDIARAGVIVGVGLIVHRVSGTPGARPPAGVAGLPRNSGGGAMRNSGGGAMMDCARHTETPRAASPPRLRTDQDER